jgi:hypothetical protein
MKKIFVILAIVLTGCVTEKKRAKICATCPIKEVRVDSTIYKEYWTFRDSVLNVLPDSAQIKYVVGPCPDGTIPAIREVYKRDGRKTSINGRVVGPKIIVAANVGPEQLKFEIRERDRIIEKLKSQVQTLPCQERWGAQFFYYSGICAYILAFLAFVLSVIWYTIKNNNK